MEIERQTITRVSPDGTTSDAANLGADRMAWLSRPIARLYRQQWRILFTTTDGWKRTLPGAPEGYKGGRIERLDLATGERRTLYESCGDHRLVGLTISFSMLMEDSISPISARYGRVTETMAGSTTL